MYEEERSILRGVISKRHRQTASIHSISNEIQIEPIDRQLEARTLSYDTWHERAENFE